ncbi:MAG: cytidylyltransferase domain-containing protein, partial [Sphaerospermopsis kisseleviana]
MKTVTIIQARMGSTRLPGKVMKPLCGKTVLFHVISRVKACSLVDEVVVATTTSLADDVIVAEAEKCG